MYFIRLYLHPIKWSFERADNRQRHSGLISTTQRSLDSRQARNLDYRPHLNGAFARRGNPAGNADRLVEIVCLDEEVAARLYTRFRERTIGHKPFAVADPNTGRHRCWMQRVGGQVLPTRMNLFSELCGFRVALLSLGFTQRLFVMIN